MNLLAMLLGYSLLVIMFIMFACMLAAGIVTTKIDKYWHPHPERLSPYAGYQINRFVGYGRDLILGRPVLKPVPWYVRLWVVGTFIFFIILIIYAMTMYFL